jgi:SAM-dependent methyltransferase
MAWLPPRDVHDGAAWDRYWQHDAEEGLSPLWGDLFCRNGPLIRCLNERGARTVLCAGNGVSQEPRGLAAAGFEVTAMDLSPVALQLAETWQLSPEELDRLCPGELRANGGSVKFVAGDILDRSVCPGPFDAIVERRMLQLFPEAERGAALDGLASRLQPSGLFLSHCHDGRSRPPNKPVHHVERFFRERGWVISESREKGDRQGRMAWLFISTG